MKFSRAFRVPLTLASAVGLLLCLALALTFLTAPGSQVHAATHTVTQDTVTHFNPGTFFHTGLTQSTLPGGAGDGNGEVRLLNIGINPETWKSDGNSLGLPATGLWGHAAVYYAGRIYVSGGHNGAGGTTGVYFTTIKANHNLNNWTATSSLPESRYVHAMTALNGYLYVIGGADSLSTASKKVYKAAVNGDGTLGTWTATNDLPVSVAAVGLYDTTAEVVSGRVYVFGGHNNAGGSHNKVYIGTQGANGVLSWTTSATTLPDQVAEHASAVSGNRVYSAGGVNNNPIPPVYSPNVYLGVPSGDGDITSWGSPSVMPYNLVHASAAAFAEEIYIAGGANNTGGSPLRSILSNLINADGSLTNATWYTNENLLSQARIQTAVVMSSDGWLYVIEGGTGSSGLTPLTTIDYGPTAAADGTAAYASTGNYVSSPFDLVSSLPVVQFRWNASILTNTALTMQYRTADTLDGLNAAAWQPVTPLTSTSGNLQTNSANLSGTARYFQYKAALSTSDNDNSPVLNWVELDYDGMETPTPTSTSTPETATSTPTVTGTPPSPTNTPTVTNTPTATNTPTLTLTPVSETPCSGKPGKPTQVSPNTGSTLLVRSVPLAWNAATCGEKYKVIVKQGSMTGPRVFKKKVDALQVVTKPLAKDNQYVWKVKACNSVGCGKWSLWWQFKVGKNASLVDPAPN